MKSLPWLVVVLLAAWIAAPHLTPARAEGEGAIAWEFKMVLVPLDRRLESYEKSNGPLLDPVQRLGEEGWELVSAYEPSHGFMAGERASTELWFKRSYVPKRRR